MRVYVIGRYDPRRAAVMPIMEMQFAAGFASNKNDVQYVVPYAIGNKYTKVYSKIEKIYKDYDLPMNFKIKFLPVIDGPHFLTAIFQIMWHSLICIKLSVTGSIKNKGQLLIFSYDVNALIPYIVFSRIFMRKKIKTLVWVFDMRFIELKRHVFVYKNTSGIVVPNNILKNLLSEILKIPVKKFVLSYHPVMEHRLNRNHDKSHLKSKFKIDNEKPLIIYTGKVFIGQKEIEYILTAAHLLPDYQFLLTGGKPHVLMHYKSILENRNTGNVIFTGFLDYRMIKYYQYVADVLISYYTRYDSASYGNPDYNLPAKTCEYMASGNPIVTCRWKGVSDLLSEKNVLFVKTDNAVALAEGIKKLVEDKNLANYLAENAYKAVQDITFEKVTQKIIEFAKSF